MHPFMLFCKKQEIRMDTVSIHTVYVAITDFPEFCLWLRRALKATYGMFSRRIVHGKVSTVDHDEKGLFAGLSSPFKAVRYHSLALDESTLPPELEITCRSEDGEVMGIRHREYLIEGIQYHPESILTSTGKRQLANFLDLVNRRRLERRAESC